jgi:hypothetical protein
MVVRCGCCWPQKMALMMRRSLLLPFVWLHLSAAEFPVFNTVAELPVDENGRLASHWLLFPPDCINTPGGLKLSHEELPGRKIGVVEGELGVLLKVTDMCPVAVALEMGTEPTYYAHHNDRFVGDRAQFNEWLDGIAHVEVGWINFADQQGVILYWVSGTGEEVEQFRIQWGEPQTHWRVVYFDHVFRVRNSKGDLIGDMVSEI